MNPSESSRNTKLAKELCETIEKLLEFEAQYSQPFEHVWEEDGKTKQYFEPPLGLSEKRFDELNKIEAKLCALLRSVKTNYSPATSRPLERDERFIGCTGLIATDMNLGCSREHERNVLLNNEHWRANLHGLLIRCRSNVGSSIAFLDNSGNLDTKRCRIKVIEGEEA